LVQPITGYKVCTYKTYRYTDITIAPAKKLIATSTYEKLDKVIIEIQQPTDTDPTDPSEPSEPSDTKSPTKSDND